MTIIRLKPDCHHFMGLCTAGGAPLWIPVRNTACYEAFLLLYILYDNMLSAGHAASPF